MTLLWYNQDVFIDHPDYITIMRKHDERLLDHIDSPVGTAQSDQNIL